MSGPQSAATPRPSSAGEESPGREGPQVYAFRRSAQDEVRDRPARRRRHQDPLAPVTGGNIMVQPERPLVPGVEVLGVVDATGPGAESWLGKRVVATARAATGGWAERSICPAVSAFEMPEDGNLDHQY